MRRPALAEIVGHCLAKPGAYLDNPFHEDDHVAKVGGKIFCYFADEPLSISVKNTREAVAEWRDRFPDHAGPGPYLHKQLWNRVLLTGRGAPGLEDAFELIDDSYDLVVASLPRARRPG